MPKKEARGSRAKRKVVKPPAAPPPSGGERPPLTWRERYGEREPNEVLLAAAAAFEAEPDEVSRNVAASLFAIARGLTAKKHDLIAEWARGARKAMPAVVELTRPSKKDRPAVARAIVKFVGALVGTSLPDFKVAVDAGLALDIASYLHRKRAAFADLVTVEDWPLDEHPVDAAKKIDDALRKHARRLNRCDPEIIAKVCLKARGLSEDDAKNVFAVKPAG